MRALTYVDIGRVEMAEVPRPVIEEPTDVLLRVTTTAICGSDLHVLHGRIPGMTEGGSLGHEFVGVVEEAGSAVRSVKAGDVFTTGYDCAVEARIEEGDVVVVQGCGPVGLMAVQAARTFKPSVICAVDSVAQRLEMAQASARCRSTRRRCTSPATSRTSPAGAARMCCSSVSGPSRR